MSAHRFWRINILGSNDASVTQFAEVIFRTVVGGANVTGTGLIATTSAYTSGHGASLAADQSPSTYAELAAVIGDWGYDFLPGNEQNIIEYAITAPSSSAAKTPKSWTLQYSDDGSSWTSLHTVNRAVFTAGSTITYRLTQLSFRNVDGSKYTTGSTQTLNFAFFQEVQPHLFTAPYVVGSISILNGLSIGEFWLPADTAGFLTVSDTDGTITSQSRAFAAPVTP